ncbi:tubulin polymerization-promoting protein homolog [Haematobia irritans]|uniref:tubulin polymerization-promoting protein homolog n=1 Tax=Haematobia irritans TaxID=7368 RepID=UPI003F500B5E
MADDDDKPKKHTLESLFHLYANNVVVPLDLDNEDYDSILLSQMDYWLEQAKLLKTVFTMTETGLVYMKFRKWRLNYQEFLDFIEQICEGKTITVDDVKTMLLEAGIPGSSTGDVVVIK